MNLAFLPDGIVSSGLQVCCYCDVCEGKTIGGTDVKLCATCAYMLSVKKGFAGLITGLILGIIVNLIIQTRKNKAEGFPLIPYLAAGLWRLILYND